MPYYSPLTDTLIVNGVDLVALPGVIVEHLDGLHAPGTRRGANDVIPGRAGQLGAPKPLDAYSFSVPVTLIPLDGATGQGNRRGSMLTNLRAITVAVTLGDGLVTLVRRLSDEIGTYAEASARGEFVDGLAMDLLNAETGRTELSFLNLDGCWHDTFVTTIAPGTVTVAGDIPTRAITLDLPGAGTLTNDTMGVAVTVTTASTLDVEAFDASAGMGTLTTTGDDSHWFVLAPGVNDITWTGGGTPSIGYRAAHL